MAESLSIETPGEHPAAAQLGDVTVVAKAVADDLRAWVLRVLKDESFGVLELCRILAVAQPALSHHLKVLHQAGLVVRRREGNSLFYRRAPAVSDLHRVLLSTLDAVELTPALQRRSGRVHAERARRSEAFFAAHVDDFATQQARICEPSVYTASVVEVIDRLRFGGGNALEVGPGDGELLVALAERCRTVVGVDSARGMLDRCAERASGLANVRLKHADLASLPARAGYDLLVAGMVLHHQASPQAFFRRVRHLLRADGALIVVELCRHDHEWARDACGDLWLGFEPDELFQWAGNAGLDLIETQFLAQKNGFRIQLHTYRNKR
jgi:ArsR family transcriptional regulator